MILYIRINTLRELKTAEEPDLLVSANWASSVTLIIFGKYRNGHNDHKGLVYINHTIVKYREMFYDPDTQH